MDVSQLPPPDIFTDYDLLQAFLKLAEKMFPSQWTRQSLEFTYFDYSARLKEFEERKPILEKTISDANSEIGDIGNQLSKITNEQETKALTTRRDELYLVISNSRLELGQFGERASLQEHVDGINRRKAVEEKLIEALKGGAVPYWLFPGSSVPYDKGPWSQEKGYSYSIELSTVWWHPKRYNLRRQSVRIYRDPFDAWLRSEFPEPTVRREPTLQERAVDFAKNYAAAARYKVKKPDVLDQLTAEFQGLTYREREAAWKAVPKELKHRGAPPKTRNK